MSRTILILVVALSLASCTAAPPAGEAVSTGEEVREDLLTSIRSSDYGGDSRGARKEGLRYLEEFAGGPEEDEVRAIVGRADIELGYHAEAGEVIAPLLDGDPQGDSRRVALRMMAEIRFAAGDYYEAAGMLLDVLSSGPSGAESEDARARLGEAVSLLPRSRLERLREEYSGYAGIDLVLEGCLQYAIEEGDTSSIRSLREQLGSMGDLRSVPDRRVSRKVTSGESVAAAESPAVEAGLSIGLLCPLSGRFAMLGEAFLEGASIAMEEAERKGMRGIGLVVGDSRGNPLAAMKVARRMIDEERVSAIVGGVLSAPTIAAAQVAQNESVVLYSPVATETGIDGIGDRIFQARTDSGMETIAVAYMACRELGLRRIAFLGAASERYERTARLFRENVEGFGAELVATDFYEEGSTDFLQNIERIRSADPEALFIASDAEDLILILPQLSFYEFGCQLLGTSAWNSRNLLRMAGRDMEGAVFPAEIEESGYEQELRTAAAFLDDQQLEVNRFSIGGYSGVRKLLEVIAMSGESGRAIGDEMARSLENRQHRYIELYSGKGIPFNTVRGERLQAYTVLGGQR